ncbi:UNVERIFIED_CONTAM: hypothetical protein GTU68_031829 [Idotea baltica]|nr:hypothetical protein [Idotea baltica]
MKKLLSMLLLEVKKLMRSLREGLK